MCVGGGGGEVHVHIHVHVHCNVWGEMVHVQSCLHIYPIIQITSQEMTTQISILLRNDL